MNIHIIGHRGNKAEYTENTLSGFKSVLEMKGVSGFELDIVVSKDQELVIVHDRFVKDIANRKHFIHTLDYSKLREYSSIIDGQVNIDNMRFPTLENLLKLYTEKNSKKIIFLEIKSVPYPEYTPLDLKELIEKVQSLLLKYNVMANCYLISFDSRILKESYRQNSDLKIGQILHANLIPLSSLVKELNLSVLIMQKAWITKEQVIEMKEKNIDVYAWTVNIYKEYNHLKKLEIKGIITDKPREFSQYNDK